MWTGQTISQFGSAISQLALPIIAVRLLDASAFAVAALGRAARRPTGRRRPDPGPDGAVRRPLRRRQLLRLRRVPRRDPEARAAAREARGRPARGHAEGALGGPALRRQASLPTAAGD